MIFSKGIAQGEGFCNRETERALLKKRILHNSHTLINGPRRIGKTSFVRKVLTELLQEQDKFVPIEIDLFPFTDANEIRSALLKAVEKNLHRVIPQTRSTFTKLSERLQRGSIEVSFQKLGFSFKIGKSPGENSSDLLSALKGLDELAHSNGVRVAFCIDEFQQLSVVKDRALEGILRTIAQDSKAITFVFSGSNRRLLNHIFDDTSRPLYRLCAREEMDRISNTSYTPFIQNAAKKRWGDELGHQEVEEILKLTDGFPFAVNSLCGLLWLKSRPPHLLEIRQYWRRIVKEEENNSKHDYDLLTGAEKKLFKIFARNKINHMGKLLTNNPKERESIISSFEKLREKDLIYKDSKGIWKVSDPITAHLLNISKEKKIKRPQFKLTNLRN